VHATNNTVTANRTADRDWPVYATPVRLRPYPFQRERNYARLSARAFRRGPRRPLLVLLLRARSAATDVVVVVPEFVAERRTRWKNNNNNRPTYHPGRALCAYKKRTVGRVAVVSRDLIATCTIDERVRGIVVINESVETKGKTVNDIRPRLVVRALLLHVRT